MFTYEEFRVCIHAFLCLYTRFFARIHAAPLQKNRVCLQSPALTDGNGVGKTGKLVLNYIFLDIQQVNQG